MFYDFYLGKVLINSYTVTKYLIDSDGYNLFLSSFILEPFSVTYESILQENERLVLGERGCLIVSGRKLPLGNQIDDEKFIT